MPVVAARAANEPAPTGETAGGRILGYDLARSLALLGMMVVHFGLVMGDDQAHPAWAAGVMKAFDGRAAATFVVLAGAGVTLLTSRAVASADPLAIAGARRILIGRGVFLLVLGFINLVIWPGDILRVYGVSLVLAAGLITAAGRRLLLVVLGFVMGFVLLLLALDYSAHWEWATMTYRGLWTPEGLARNLVYDGFRSVFPWTGLMVFGMWLGRHDLRDRAVNSRFLLAALGIVAFAEATSRLCVSYFRAHPHGMSREDIYALFGTESMPPMPLFLLAAGGAAVAVIALCVRLAEARSAGPWLKPPIAAGQMALTWYFAHIVLGLGTIVALGLDGSQPLPIAEVCGLLFFATAVAASWLWRKGFRHGPLEWVMRALAG